MTKSPNTIIGGYRPAELAASRQAEPSAASGQRSGRQDFPARHDGNTPTHRRGQVEADIIGPVPESWHCSLGMDLGELRTVPSVQPGRAGGHELEVLPGTQRAREPDAWPRRPLPPARSSSRR